MARQRCAVRAGVYHSTQKFAVLVDRMETEILMRRLLKPMDAAGIPARQSFFESRASAARSFKYCFMGRAGVPQKTIPFPRITFLLGMPLWAPRMAPSSMQT